MGGGGGGTERVLEGGREGHRERGIQRERGTETGGGGSRELRRGGGGGGQGEG